MFAAVGMTRTGRGPLSMIAMMKARGAQFAYIIPGQEGSEFK
jgi:hypothetical protein